MGHLLYFATDELMDERALLKIAPSAELFGRAQLPDHVLGLTAQGRLTVMPKSKIITWGVLWMFDVEHLPAIDAAHGVDRGFHVRTTLRIISPAGPPTAAIYYEPGEKPDGEVPPQDWALITVAARAQGLPDSHQVLLETLATKARKNSC